MAESELLKETKHWNQNRLFLAWGFLTALMSVTALELFKIYSKDYTFNIFTFINGIFTGDYYLDGIFVFFFFSLVISLKISKIIDEKSNTLQGTLNTLSNKKNLVRK